MPQHTFIDPCVVNWSRKQGMPPPLATLRGHTTWYNLTQDLHPRGSSWYDRKVRDIRSAHEKHRMWHYDKSHKPAERQAFGERWENRVPAICSGKEETYRKRLELSYHIPMPKHGIYHPPHYAEPCGVAALPPIVQ